MIAPSNFGYIEDGVYRSGSPDARNHGFIASLQLRTCILLTDSHDPTFVQFLHECGVSVLCPLSTSAHPYRGPASCRPSPAAAAPDTLQHGGGGGPNAAAQQYLHMARHQQPQQQQRVAQRPAPEDDGGGPEDLRASHDGGPFESTAGPASSVQNGSMVSLSPPGSPMSPDASVNRQSNVARFLRENTAMASQGGGGGGGRAPGSSLAPVAGAAHLSPDAAGSPQFIPGPYDELGSGSLSGGGAYAYGMRLDSGGGGTAHHNHSSSNNKTQKDPMTLPESVVVDILHVLLDPAYYPVLVTCPMGRYRTGIVCGCLRKLQRWNLVSILEEYRRFAGDKSRADNEDFIELFDKDLVSLELPGGRRPTILYQERRTITGS